MGESDRATLLRLLLEQYQTLEQRFVRRLGTRAAASDALHDAYLRIRMARAVPKLDDAASYLGRIVGNVAADHRRSASRRLLSQTEIAASFELPSDVPGPDGIAESRSEVMALQAALRELPARRRAIFIAARVQGRPHQAIADSLGLSRRTVETEIQRALDHCAARLGKLPAGTCTLPRRKASRG